MPADPPDVIVLITAEELCHQRHGRDPDGELASHGRLDRVVTRPQHQFQPCAGQVRRRDSDNPGDDSAGAVAHPGIRGPS